jgi:hypothetical protein
MFLASTGCLAIEALPIGANDLDENFRPAKILMIILVKPGLKAR